MAHNDPLLTATPILDFGAAPIAELIAARGWRALSDTDKIGAIYDYIRNEIAFGYNRADDIPASEVLSDGYGQCNTKGTLLMALLRGVGIKCRSTGSRSTRAFSAVLCRSWSTRLRRKRSCIRGSRSHWTASGSISKASFSTARS